MRDHNQQPANVSVVVIARNEEANLPRCLKAVTFTDDILVVDDGSEDNTVKVAEQAGARVVAHPMKNFADQRNWAMENGKLQNDWVLHLDADEVITEELAGEIPERVRHSAADVAGFYMSRKTMLGNRWLRFSATYPAWVPRLVSRNRVRFIQDGHGDKLGEVRGGFEYLKNPCLHYNFSKGWSDWLARHNSYSTLEAIKLIEDMPTERFSSLFSIDPATRRKALRSVSYRLPLRPWLRFFYVYVLRLGFLDGKPGLTYSVLQAFYEYMICLKVSEMREKM